MDTTLEGYLASDFRIDRQEIETLDRHLRMATETFEKTFCDPQWPYEFVTTGKPQTPEHFSQGTAAMALTAVGRLIGTCEEGLPVPLQRDALQKQWKACFDALKDDLAKLGSSFPRGKKVHVRSSTFGNNNAITLSHLAELSRFSKINIDVENIEASFEIIKTQLDNLRNKSVDFLSIPQSKGHYQRSNAFVPLRAIRACRFRNPKESFSQLKPFFESILHDQLSFSGIPDSRFDPAELLFCLEGLLLCDQDAVEATLFDRVLHVLSEKQNTNAHWRPNRPFIASPTGYVVLPISVEGANSLMRSVKIMDEERTFDLFASKAAPLLRRFWSWLVAQSVRFEMEGRDCVGWHSEHVNEPDQIHLWDTSQVVEFMIAYRRLLTGNVAHRTLLLSNVKVRQPVPLEETIKVEKPTWNHVVADREPLMGETDEQAYLEVGKKYVVPRLERRKKYSYSMLLYGPPGTGKSSLAELMADALNWPLITVTVSDFLGSGGAMVEARAKAIFQMLEAQEQAVILFDEIDSFLLDRDSKFYRDQETLFQFITPGMLTKINDLRKAERSIFIIATNYANRIDPAIKRVGRIDDRILLLPPNLARRKAMIEKAWAARNEGLDEGARKALPTYVDEMAKAFCYLGWNDIKDVVKKVFDAPPSNAEGLMGDIRRIDRSTGPKFYGRRFPVEQPFEDEIRKEVVWLAKLTDESGDGQFAKEFADAATQAATGMTAKAEKAISSAADAFVKSL